MNDYEVTDVLIFLSQQVEKRHKNNETLTQNIVNLKATHTQQVTLLNAKIGMRDKKILQIIATLSTFLQSWYPSIIE